MKIKIKEKTVKEFTIKLTDEEFIGLHSDLVDVLECGDISGNLTYLIAVYDAVRARVHGS